MNKQVNAWEKFQLIDVMQAISFVWSQWRKHHLPLAIFILLCLNVVIAPIIYAVANSIFEYCSDWAKELKLKIKN
ncbi:K(+)-transporting ATPase subunit F [Nostoc sp. CHAB 5824]|nr:K(+)-transporting ATPase subunit F [Nostoc sp. CHAB 5824]